MIVLRAEAAEGRSSNRPSPDLQDLTREMATRGVDLHPLHPDSKDPDARRYLFASAEGLEAPDETARLIAEFDYVEAAYYKPPDETPGSPNQEKETEHG